MFPILHSEFQSDFVLLFPYGGCRGHLAPVPCSVTIGSPLQAKETQGCPWLCMAQSVLVVSQDSDWGPSGELFCGMLSPGEKLDS